MPHFLVCGLDGHLWRPECAKVSANLSDRVLGYPKHYNNNKTKKTTRFCSIIAALHDSAAALDQRAVGPVGLGIAVSQRLESEEEEEEGKEKE